MRTTLVPRPARIRPHHRPRRQPAHGRGHRRRRASPSRSSPTHGRVPAVGVRHRPVLQRRLHQPQRLHVHVLRADQPGDRQRHQDLQVDQRLRHHHHRRHRDRPRVGHLQPLERLQGRHLPVTTCTTNYITSHYTYSGVRGDGATLYTARLRQRLRQGGQPLGHHLLRLWVLTSATSTPVRHPEPQLLAALVLELPARRLDHLASRRRWCRRTSGARDRCRGRARAGARPAAWPWHGPAGAPTGGPRSRRGRRTRPATR